MRFIQGSVLLAAVAVSGCSTLSKQECLRGDWDLIGRHDAMDGHAPQRFDEHVKACAKHSVHPDKSAYLAGFNEGLKEFCTEDGGWKFGLSGKSYSGICPPELQQKFLPNYETALSIRRLEDENRRLEEGILNLRQGQLGSRPGEQLRADLDIAAARMQISMNRDRIAELEARRIAPHAGEGESLRAMPK